MKRRNLVDGVTLTTTKSTGERLATKDNEMEVPQLKSMVTAANKKLARFRGTDNNPRS